MVLGTAAAIDDDIGSSCDCTTATAAAANVFQVVIDNVHSGSIEIKLWGFVGIRLSCQSLLLHERCLNQMSFRFLLYLRLLFLLLLVGTFVYLSQTGGPTE